MRRKNILLSFIVGLSVCIGMVLLFIDTPKSNSEPQTVPVVAATIFPVYDIARIVAGEDAQVTLLIPPGVSEHSGELSPQDMKRLSAARMVFAVGHNLDTSITRLATSVGVPVVTLDNGVTLRPYEDDHHEENESHEEDHGEFDPHYWLDPDNAALMASQIAEALAQADEMHRAQYVDRANAFHAVLSEKDATWRARLTHATKPFFTFHDAFYYFADHFGVSVAGTFEPFPGVEPSPQYLAALEKEVTHDNIRIIFREPQLSAQTLEAFAADHGLSLGILDPVGGLTGRESYIDLMEYNVSAIEAAMK